MRYRKALIEHPKILLGPFLNTLSHINHLYQLIYRFNIQTAQFIEQHVFLLCNDGSYYIYTFQSK